MSKYRLNQIFLETRLTVLVKKRFSLRVIKKHIFESRGGGTVAHAKICQEGGQNEKTKAPEKKR